MPSGQMDIALLVLRVVFGVVLAGHGTQKLFGWFGGAGLTGFSGSIQRMGLRPAGLWAWVSALVETFGGLLLALGLLTPVATGLLICNMLMAIIQVHWKNGFWNANRGLEFPLTLISGLLAIALAGPGAYAIGPVTFAGLIPLGLFVAVLVIGLIGVPIALATGQRHPERRTAR